MLVLQNLMYTKLTWKEVSVYSPLPTKCNPDSIFISVTARSFFRELSSLSRQFISADLWKLKTKLFSIKRVSNQFCSYFKQNYIPEVLQNFYYFLPEDPNFRDELYKVVEQLFYLKRDSTKKSNKLTIKINFENTGILSNHSLLFQIFPDLAVYLEEAAPAKRKLKYIYCQELGHMFINCTKKSRWSARTCSKR